MLIITDTSSNNRHPIDWAALRAAGVHGNMHKATEGAGYVSPTFGSDYRDSLAAGLVPGAYHFWRWLEPLKPQFDNFTAHYGRRDGDLAPGWDIESYGGHQPGVDRSWAELAGDLAIVAWVLASTYGDGWFYCPRSVHEGLSTVAGYPYNRGIWLAQGVAATRATAMQFAPARFPGIADPVDWSIL